MFCHPRIAFPPCFSSSDFKRFSKTCTTTTRMPANGHKSPLHHEETPRIRTLSATLRIRTALCKFAMVRGNPMTGLVAVVAGIFFSALCSNRDECYKHGSSAVNYRGTAEEPRVGCGCPSTPPGGLSVLRTDGGEMDTATKWNSITSPERIVHRRRESFRVREGCVCRGRNG